MWQRGLFKRGLFIRQKRPVHTAKRPVHVAKEACSYGERGLFIWRGRPVHMAKRPVHMAKAADLRPPSSPFVFKQAFASPEDAA